MSHIYNAYESGGPRSSHRWNTPYTLCTTQLAIYKVESDDSQSNFGIVSILIFHTKNRSSFLDLLIFVFHMRDPLEMRNLSGNTWITILRWDKPRVMRTYSPGFSPVTDEGMILQVPNSVDTQKWIQYQARVIWLCNIELWNKNAVRHPTICSYLTGCKEFGLI